jgi:hypothetical protein
MEPGKIFEASRTLFLALAGLFFVFLIIFLLSEGLVQGVFSGLLMLSAMAISAAVGYTANSRLDSGFIKCAIYGTISMLLSLALIMIGGFVKAYLSGMLNPDFGPKFVVALAVALIFGAACGIAGWFGANMVRSVRKMAKERQTTKQK